MTRSNPDRGEPTTTVREDDVVGYDPGFGPEWAAEVKARRNADGTITILDVKTWDPSTPPSTTESKR